MRIRVVRPDFWSDDVVGQLSDPARLFYIGLWCLADDAGWLEWKPSQIGATLYPYKAASKREREIVRWGDELTKVGKIVIHPCGCGLIPTLVKHQKQGGNPSFQYREKHRRHVADSVAGVDDESRLVHTSTPLEKGREGREGREGSARGAREIDDDGWEQKIVEMRRRGERA